MTKSRRDALSMLGLASVGSASLATEVLAGEGHGSTGPQVGTVDHGRVARALRNLADAIDSRDVEVEGLQVSSRIGFPNEPVWSSGAPSTRRESKGLDWLVQDMHLAFYLRNRDA
jgi:hypothetical protein